MNANSTSADGGHYIAWTRLESKWLKYDDAEMFLIEGVPDVVQEGVVLVVYVESKGNVPEEVGAKQAMAMNRRLRRPGCRQIVLVAIDGRRAGIPKSCHCLGGIPFEAVLFRNVGACILQHERCRMGSIWGALDAGSRGIHA